MDIPETELVGLDLNNLDKKIELFKYFYFGNKVKYYEEIVKFFGNIIKLKSSDKKRKEFEKINSELLLNVSIDEIDSASIFLLTISLIFGIALSMLISPIYFVFFLFLGILGYILTDYYYIILYNSLKVRKKSQLINLLLLLAIKLRQNPNVEQALIYSARNIGLPLKIDLLRLLRDIYNRKYVSASEALLEYAKNWEIDARFFYLGIMLIEGALLDPDKDRRNFQIDKSIEESLEELINELYAFAREIRSSVNLVSMLGITLPVMLLTIFPLASIFLSNLFSPLLLFILFDILIPFLSYFFLNYSVSSKMLNIFSSDDIYLFYYIKKKDIKNKLIAFSTAVSLSIFLFFLIVLVIYNYISNYNLAGIIFSEFFVLLIGLTIGFGSFLYYNDFRELYKDLIKIEVDLPSFLLSVGNALNEGYPLEKALAYVYPRYKDSPIGKVIAKLYQNLRSGLPFYDAIFDPKVGAIMKVPSSQLKASMEILYEASKVSSSEASLVGAVVSKYFILLEKVKERIKDLVAEDISQLKSLLRMLAPVILGIVSAVTIMTIEILYSLSIQIKQLTQFSSSASQYSSYVSSLPTMILNMFNLNGIVSPPTIIIIIGLFNELTALIIIYAINSIENSGDKLSFFYDISKYYVINTLLFVIFSAISSVALYLFVKSILSISNFI
ncbi:MAG: hypothetical protein ACP5GJ_02135 [Nanopusillaceae archaeon]|jgi:hypothetical protein